MPQHDPSSVEGLIETIGDQLTEQVASRQSGAVELSPGGATLEEATRIGDGRGHHGLITEIQP